MTQSVQQAMAAFSPARPLAVAYSGGADSTALLLACVHQWPGQVSAIHVHHGLQSAADDFERHCRAVCSELKVPLIVKSVDARHAPGQSPEDAARRARYKAFSAAALDHQACTAIKTIAIAHHADDQAETLLLALSRGSGLPGLSAMPQQWQHQALTYCRPLLHVSSVDLRCWLANQGVTFIEDPTNTNECLTRNRIRARLLPALQTAFPQFRDTLARSAAHAAQAQVLLQEVAQQDLAQVGLPPNLRSLQSLSRPRLANVLRHWLKSTYQVVPRSNQLNELIKQIVACTTRGHKLHIKVGNGFCTRSGAVIDWYNASCIPNSALPCP